MDEGKTAFLPTTHVAVMCGDPAGISLSGLWDQRHPIPPGCRLSALEELSGVEVLASDKTGTLTLNQ